MKTYRVAIIGLSGIAARPLATAPDPVLGNLMPHSHAAAYAAIPRTSVVAVCIDHTRRWYPEFVEARRLVRAGAIGRLRRIAASLDGPRAMLFRDGTHLIDMACCLCRRW